MTHFVSKDKIIENLREKRKELQDKLDAVKDWWDLYNQNIDSEAIKDKLHKILEDEK